MKAFGITDKGCVRSVNQDAFRFTIDDPAGHAVAVLCDGMGGEKAGEVASEIASEAFVRYAGNMIRRDSPLSVDAAREAAAYANVQVYDRSVTDEKCFGMGTTLVAAVVCPEDAAVVNVGDSRCYWLAEDQLLQVTRDHSWVQQLVDEGAITQQEAREHPKKNVITRAVGMHRRVSSDIFRLDLQPGDRLLLCSDGLSNTVADNEIADILRSRSDAREACETLLELSLSRGAPDNVTALILDR